MALPANVGDREFQKFAEGPTGTPNTRTVVGQGITLFNSETVSAANTAVAVTIAAAANQSPRV